MTFCASSRNELLTILTNSIKLRVLWAKTQLFISFIGTQNHGWQYQRLIEFMNEKFIADTSYLVLLRAEDRQNNLKISSKAV